MNSNETKLASISNQLSELRKAAPDLSFGELSDGYHTFNSLYHTRAKLFSIICNQNSRLGWKSKKHSDGTMFEGMFIVGLSTPLGQATYHYDMKYWEDFKVSELEEAPEWDGHTEEDVFIRLQSLLSITI